MAHCTENVTCLSFISPHKEITSSTISKLAKGTLLGLVLISSGILVAIQPALQ